MTASDSRLFVPLLSLALFTDFMPVKKIHRHQARYQAFNSLRKHQEIAERLEMIDPAEVSAECRAMYAKASRKKHAHELVPFLAIWAVQYQRDYRLNGLHPIHYDLLKKYGARIDSFQRATNATTN